MKTQIKITLLLATSYWLWGLTAHSQSLFQLQLSPATHAPIFEKHNIAIQSTHPDSLAVQQHLSDLVQTLQQAAYLETSIDSITYTEQKVVAKIHLGLPYQWIQLHNGNIPLGVLQKLHLGVPFFENKPLNWDAFLQIKEDLLAYAESNGHPFAEIWLDFVKIKQQAATASLFWNLNQEIRFGKIKIIGDANIHPHYLAHYIGISEGSLYNQDKVLDIEKKLATIPFIRQKASPKVTFEEGTATVHLFLEAKNTNRFDFLLGVLPDNRPSLEGRSLVVTGSGTMDLYNAFGRGERIAFELQQIRPLTQEFKSRIQYPYLFNTPLGLDARLELFRNDSTNLLVETELGLQYLFDSQQYLKAFYNQKKSRLLSINEFLIITQKQLPFNLDTRQQQYGLEYLIQRFDTPLNPRYGWSMQLQASVGQKSVRVNNEIADLVDENEPNFDFAQLYTPYRTPSSQYQFRATLSRFLPLGKRTTLHLRSQNGTIINQENPVFENEFFRIGGNRLQRGFDESSILAQHYSVNTIEYRWLLSRQSNVFVFADGAYVEASDENGLRVQQLLGLGAGLQLDTNAGLVGMSLSLGRDYRTAEDTWDLRNPKVHFGYIRVF